MLRDVLDFQQQPETLSQSDLRHRAIQDAVDAARRRPGEFALHDALAALTGSFEQRQQGFGASRQFRDAPAERLIGPHAEQGLRGRVQIEDL